MREIKFRAWDKGLKNMYHTIIEIEYDSTGRIPKRISYPSPTGYSSLYDFELMQFTGLHDKNGKEVYEFDILNRNGNLTLKVEWSEEFAEWMFVDENDNNWDKNLYQYEIIGNIHENPELLKPQ